MKLYLKASRDDEYLAFKTLDAKILNYLGDRLIDKAYQDANRISYVFKINNHNVYRVIVDTELDEMIVQAVKYASKTDDGYEVYDDPHDIDSIQGPKDEWLDYLVSIIDECEKEDPNYTEYLED